MNPDTTETPAPKPTTIAVRAEAGHVVMEAPDPEGEPLRYVLSPGAALTLAGALAAAAGVARG
jgi:hypothetical protein